MTTLLALENSDLNEVVTFSDDAINNTEGSGIYRDYGEQMTMEQCLYAVMLNSANECAYAVAEHVGGTVEHFVDMMNEKAAELGCTDTVFENPHGLDDGEFAGDQHSCAADVAKMARYAMRNETFRAIVGGGDTGIVVDRADGTRATIELESTDELMDYYDKAIGIKTGFTALAGPSFAGAASNGEKELYAIVIHSTSETQRFNDAETLFEWVYEHERDYPLANSTQTASMTVGGQTSEVPVVAEVPHADWIDKTVKATLSDPEASVRIFDLNGNISQSVEYDELMGNVHAGDKIGTLTFKQRNSVMATVDLIAAEDVNAPDLFEGIGVWWDRLFRGFSGQSTVAESVLYNETPLVVDKTSA